MTIIHMTSNVNEKVVEMNIIVDEHFKLNQFNY